MDDVTLIHGDCLDRMREMAPASVDAVVTDPPYGLSFLGREWDHGVPGVLFWEAALRVAKPGAHLVAFGGTRTFHRLACAIEDAGWEMRDCLSWLYGQGMPKGKHQLKPAWEPILLARKPPDGTVARNVAEHGCGGLNVDGCRIHPNGPRPLIESRSEPALNVFGNGLNGSRHVGTTTQGRWPANAILSHTPECRVVGVRKVKGTAPPGPNPGQTWKNMNDGFGPHNSRDYTDPDGTETVAAWECSDDCPVRLLDEMAGARRTSNKAEGLQQRSSRADYRMLGGTSSYTDKGGASRFMYCPKASPSERAGATHPTVKPLALMTWLVRLVTPPGGLVLDPFLGSGTTALACLNEGCRCVGIEQNPDYLAMARARLDRRQSATPLLTGGVA